jgi:hypothetical protein
MKDLDKIKNSNNKVGEVINFEKAGCRSFDAPELIRLLRSSGAIMMSWGAHNFIVDDIRNTKMFRMLVQGHHHKGYVYIFLNGLDLFDVYLTTTQGTIKARTGEMGIYFDQLVEWIDERVERIPAYVS